MMYDFIKKLVEEEFENRKGVDVGGWSSELREDVIDLLTKRIVVEWESLFVNMVHDKCVSETKYVNKYYNETRKAGNIRKAKRCSDKIYEHIMRNWNSHLYMGDYDLIE